MMEPPAGACFAALARGEDPDLQVHRGYQVGGRVHVPPFPIADQTVYDGNSRNAAIVFETDDREGVHIEDAKRVDGQWRAAGESGMSLVVTGTGETMAEARAQAYGRIDDVIVPNMYYREDIGERWIEGDGDRLQAWGYLGPS